MSQFENVWTPSNAVIVVQLAKICDIPVDQMLLPLSSSHWSNAYCLKPLEIKSVVIKRANSLQNIICFLWHQLPRYLKMSQDVSSCLGHILLTSISVVNSYTKLYPLLKFGKFHARCVDTKHSCAGTNYLLSYEKLG